ncbi:fumarate/nitrate reduction transcriptional regulator Fnr [Thalassotalea mangrovi]|uniref:Fumarate/nitrate reduction transcriptional regulator Fnr n=1 Tax=Thalassotalea mangrovi TaxID=2572245 RepID=A0A4U1B5S1_9GAMM|nr:fumarate/nitrate reduction transcriptional regulator Fnr [Thalassotalea mangrovi]TKB45832.1 fumarate/nitrate reduction transcriptional regulator Fnr [Thalassotalea mangrovi]
MSLTPNISCANCRISELCLPFSLSNTELNLLDEIIKRKKPIQKNQVLFHSGDPLLSLFAIRSGTFKTFINTARGEQQITGFHLPGDVLGFDALSEKLHTGTAQALETAMVCEIPFDVLDQLSNQIPRLKTQIMALMSMELGCNQQHLLSINQENAEQKLARFLIHFGERLSDRQLSSQEFQLPMTRTDLGNYLGLTVETVSRLLSRFQQNGWIKLDRKFVTIEDSEALQNLYS